MTKDSEIFAVFIEEAAEFLDGLRTEHTSMGIAERVRCFRESCRLVGFREPRYEAEDVISHATRAASLNHDLSDSVRRYSEALISELASMAEENGKTFSANAVILAPVEVVATKAVATVEKPWWRFW